MQGKVLVVGAAEAGKSTLIGTLCSDAVNLEVGGRTVGFDHGILRRGDDKLSLVGVPGQERFAAVRDSLSAAVLSVIWVHKAGEDYCQMTAAMVGELAAPYIVFVNHHGLRVGGTLEAIGDSGLRPAAILSGDLKYPRPGLMRDLEGTLWTLARDSAGGR